MSLRYLFGPVSADFSSQNLDAPAPRGACLAFGARGSTDVTLGRGDTWEALLARLPAGWRPDFVALYLPYTTVPPCLWSAPVPRVGLAADANLLFHQYRHQLRRCDLVLADQAAVEALAREGLKHARPANLFGLEQAFLDEPAPDGPRDVDIAFAGSLHAAIQRERLPWLGRLARLGGRWRVAVHTGVFGADYRVLLRRARIAFNRSIRGECNKRAFEAVAAGALLFQEAGNREVPAYFRDRRECVFYDDDNLEALLEHYLEHEDERRAVAEAARAALGRSSFAALWQEQVARLEDDWPALRERAGRLSPAAEEDLLGRTWQALGSADGDRALPADLAAALAQAADPAALQNALGLTAAAAVAVGHFRQALVHDPQHVVAGLNLAEALAALGKNAEAVQAARNALALLERLPGLPAQILDAGHFPPAFDLFRVEWERAAWANAGRPAGEARAKRALLRWRLHALLASLTGDLAHYHEAALARPDLPATRAALGYALGRAGRAAEAVPHLRRAVADDPFDRAAARALFQALGEAGDADGQRRLARDRRLLSRAAPQAVPTEPWFAEEAPVGDELASLIILCCNEVDCTRPCLESVLRHTRPPYELVLVDNGSTDGTPAYLEEVRSRAGPERVEVIRNEANAGFPAGCNQGLARARGRYVVFLNNDTIVTAGWLDGLIAWALHDWPRVGLVGAVTNASAAPQQVAPGYADLSGLDAFAARRRREYAGRALPVERLKGFCLLARREVLERTGGFDERFGLGFFDDDDLSVREAGFQLLVALGVYVHHFGSRTFAGLGVDCAAQLRGNFEQFRAKWGPEHSAGYRLPDDVEQGPLAPASGEGGGGAGACVCVSGAGAMQSIPLTPDPSPPSTEARAEPCSPPRWSPSTPRPHAPGCRCAIVKDEEANLPDCLGPVMALVDDAVVVDTGSTDRTKEVAAALGAGVFDFPWCDSFAAARNETLRHATGDWIFWLDADDRLDDDNRRKLGELFAGLDGENAAYAMKCLCLPDPVTKTATAVDHVRLFRNRPDVRWQWRVHEQILPAVRRAGGEVRWSDVVIHHTGYQDPPLRRRKLDRDLRLLLLEDAEHPDDPFTLFNLGAVYAVGRPDRALAALRRSLGRSDPRDSIVRKLYALIVQCHRQLGQPAEALAACRAGRGLYPDDAELLFGEGTLRHQLGDPAGAEACLLRLLESREPAHFASIDTGVCGYKARHNLAVLYREQGRAAEAEAQWQAAVAEQPDFPPAWLGLAELALAAQRWADLDGVLGRLQEQPEGPLEAAVLRARGALARREFDPAREVLHAAIAEHPRALGPRVILSHVLLQEGRDWDAAECALLDVLALAPEHAEAWRNLAVLRRQAGRATADPAQDTPGNLAT